VLKSIEALRKKNVIEHKYNLKRREELNTLRVESAYRAKLYDEIKVIELLLNDDNVKSVVIEVPKQHITKFLRAIYGEEFMQYNITQLDEYTFEIGRKIVNF
jgi:hypothetical protein